MKKTTQKKHFPVNLARSMPGMVTGIFFCIVLSGSLGAENIIFPSNAGVVDVTQPPYSVDNTGKTDVTAKLQRIINANSGWKTIYLPNGTYLVSSTLKWISSKPNLGPILQGQSRKKTVIKLANNVATGPGKLPVLQTGTSGQQNFGRGLFNFTVLIGEKNPNAIGIAFYGNKQSLLAHIDILAQEESGLIGLHTSFGDANGPACVGDVSIKGFDIGISAGHRNSLTYTNITVEKQRKSGIQIGRGHNAIIENFTSINAVPAIDIQEDAWVTIVNADCNGGIRSLPAISSKGVMYIRGITTRGYKCALSARTSAGNICPTAKNIGEFSSHGGQHLFYSPQRSLCLEIQQAPEIAWEQDVGQWVSIDEFLSRSGAPSQERTPAQALQKAIDKGKSTVLVPSGRQYTIDDTVYVRGGVQRIIGTPGTLTGAGALVILDGESPFVKIERLYLPTILNRSSRVLILESVLPDTIIVDGPGETFITDAVSLLNVRHHDARVWARHLNTETTRGNDITLSEGFTWILGWQSTRNGMKLNATGGQLEVLGMFLDSPIQQTYDTPLFSFSNTSFSIANMKHSPGGTKNRSGNDNAVLVSETRNSETKKLRVVDNDYGNSLPLFSAIQDTETPTAGLFLRKAESSDVKLLSCRYTEEGVHFTYRITAGDNDVVVQLLNALGQPILRKEIEIRKNGIHSGMIPVQEKLNGVYFFRISTGSSVSIRRLIINQ